jgi:hypothetical protein
MDPVAVLELPPPLALALPPVAVLLLKLPLALAADPVAVLVLKMLLLALALLPVAVLWLLSPLAAADGPQAKLVLVPARPVAVAPPPSAVAGGTVAPSAFPTQTNCAAAGRGASRITVTIVAIAQPADNAAPRLLTTFDMTSPL